MHQDEFSEHAAAIMHSMNTVIDGKEQATEMALTVLLAQGHLLLQDVPGVGKTLLAKALALSIDGSVSRIQFTPDLLPSDISGVNFYNQSNRSFEFRPGPIFANIVIGDEINRASAKTQSALLESMEEAQVTSDTTTYQLPRPFMVVATQNPVEMEGTYALPEAQRDRFMMQLSLGYPDAGAEKLMLTTHAEHNPLADIAPQIHLDQLESMIAMVREVYVSESIKDYVIQVAQSTRNSESLSLGASPRALLQWLRAGKARSALRGRNYVIPEDLSELGVAVLAHRVIPARSPAAGPLHTEQVVRDILRSVPNPSTL